MRQRFEIDRDNLLSQLRTDQLTGLFNQQYLLEEGRRIYERQMNNLRAKALGIILFDLNGFKAVNDQLGQQQGDDVLKIFADLLRDAFRPGDLIIVRIHGDEFLVMLTRLPEGEEYTLLEKRVQMLDGVLRIKTTEHFGLMVSVTASINIFHPGNSVSFPDALTLSDRALQEKKVQAGHRR